MFAHMPGLKVVRPSDPYSAKGLLIAALRDDDPVIYCEHKLLYPMTGPVPVGINKSIVPRTSSQSRSS